MIRIMIVDDMPVFREYLVSCIDWAAYGFEICCEAKDGKEALEKFDEANPDIVLTDITMPYIDGINLAEQLLMINSEVSVVFITGNSEFEYARRAVKMGACDYIVKPFDKEELIFSLLKLKDNINKTIEMQIEKEEFNAQAKEEALRKLIYKQNGPITEIELQQLHSNCVNFNTEYFLVCTVKIATYENSKRTDHIIKWEDVLINMLKDMIQIEGKFEMFRDFEGNIITILNFDSKREQKEYKGYEFKDLIKLVKQSLEFDITVGISELCDGIQNIKDAYYQTLRMINKKYQDDKGNVHYYNEAEAKEWKNFYSWDVIDSINKNLETLNYDGIQSIFVQELDTIEDIENEEFGTMIFMSLLSLLLSFLIKKGRNIEDVFGQYFKPYEMIMNTPGYLAKRGLSLDCYRTVINYLSENKNELSYLVAQKAKDFIVNHYSDASLSIDDIARHLLMNQTYLRKMFKSETNMTLSEYITKIRMEKAKELIQNSNFKISYISTIVGYNDVGYFGKCFKKYYGISPGAVNVYK